MLEFPGERWICENLRFSAKICVLGSLCHLSSVPLSTPWRKEIVGWGGGLGHLTWMRSTEEQENNGEGWVRCLPWPTSLNDDDNQHLFCGTGHKWRVTSPLQTRNCKKWRQISEQRHDSRAAKRGCVSNGGVSRSGLVLSFFFFFPFLSFWDFPGDFPDLLGDGPGIFPIGPFPLSRPTKSTYEEQSRKGPRHNLDLSRKKWETPGFGNTPV